MQTNTPDVPRFYRPAFLAKQFGISRAAISLWVTKRKIAVVRMGRAVLIPDFEVERLIRERTVPRHE